jgi:aspartate aminotransferase
VTTKVVSHTHEESNQMRFAQRTTKLRAEGAYQVLEKAQRMESNGRDVVHLEVGQPDYSTFPHVAQAGIAAISQGYTRYSPAAGEHRLREIVADSVKDSHGLDIRPDQVVITPGSKPGLFFATLALIEPGDEVIYPNPGFPTYESMIEVAGGIPVPIPLLEDRQFSFDLTVLDRLVGPQTKMIILNSPGNPTGGVIPREDLDHIAQICQRHRVWVLSDEIYRRMTYDGRVAHSVLSIKGMEERAIVVDGFSKSYSMTGWRLGYGIMPKPLAEKVELLLTHSVGCTAQFTQFAGMAALTGPQDEVDRMVEDFQKRRDFVVAALNAIPGIHCSTPQGAFYVFPNIQALGMSSSELADQILEETGVALLPGTSFGMYGEGYLRLSYAASLDEIKRGMERVTEFVRSLN